MNLAALTPATVPALECSGTLAGWSAVANRLFAPGCEAQGFGLLAAFGAPILPLCHQERGGIVVSIWGGPGSGKSLMLTAGQSAFPGEEEPHTNGRYEHLIARGNLPVFDASLGYRDPGVVKDYLMAFSRHHADPLWTTFLIATSPIGLSEHGLFQFGIELEVKVPPALKEPKVRRRDMLDWALIENRGNAGRLYLETLARPEIRRWAKRQALAKVIELSETLGAATGAPPPAVYAIACAHVAALLCADLGILEVSPGRITDWAMERTRP